MITPLKTAFDLQCAMQAFVTTFVPACESITLENVYWFVAIQEARQLVEGTTKDIAHHLLHGCAAIDEAYVEGWLESCYELNEQGEVEVEFVDFKKEFNRHFLNR